MILRLNHPHFDPRQHQYSDTLLCGGPQPAPIEGSFSVKYTQPEEYSHLVLAEHSFTRLPP